MELAAQDIVLDEPYLHHLREAAFDWAIEYLAVAQEPDRARRAAIVFARHVVTLVDEVRRLRAEIHHGD